MGEVRFDSCLQFDHLSGVVGVDQTSFVDREIDQGESVPANGLIVDVEQLGERLDLVVFGGMVEPSRSGRYVDLGRYPVCAILMTVAQLLVERPTRIDLVSA